VHVQGVGQLAILSSVLAPGRACTELCPAFRRNCVHKHSRMRTMALYPSVWYSLSTAPGERGGRKVLG
jgi:hypothetical protein